MSDSLVQRPQNAQVSSEQKLASCYNCKRSKLKCVRDTGTESCERCKQRNIACEAPAYHIGRHKGVKNKHSGLEKAVVQIEQALRRSSRGGEQIRSAEQASELRYLLDRSRELLNAESGHSRSYSVAAGDHPSYPHASSVSATSPPMPSPSQGTPQSQGASSSLESTVEDEHLNLDDAENPLQLLARTSELLSSINAPPVSTAPPSFPSTSHQRSSIAAFASTPGGNSRDLQGFFGPFHPRLDLGEELDPIDLGLVTLAETEALFSFFFDNLAHTRWGIDPVIHTVEFVRQRSAFLLTSIAAASAMFSPSMESLYKRLSSHRQTLANLVMAKRYKSVEIILAFMVNIPWISVGEHWLDDETSTYLSMALTIALDLSLNKIIIAAPPGGQRVHAAAQCVSAHKALALDGFHDVDPNALLGRRLLRRRERTWLSLFVLERGVCLARGRDYVLPLSPLINNCDDWHLHQLADRWDGSIVSVAVLRRDMANLITQVRDICDGFADGTTSEVVIVEGLKNEISTFFDRWYQTWPLQIGDREQLALPPYVEILASHTRLSMYSSVVNHPSAPTGARHFFRAAGLSAALNVLRVAVQGERQLRSMPNNTAIMISFAACFALRISNTVAEKGGGANAGGDGAGGSSGGQQPATTTMLAPSIRNLIAETTDVLERIGSNPVQRKGLSCLFARQLRGVLKGAVAARGAGGGQAEGPMASAAATTATGDSLKGTSASSSLFHRGMNPGSNPHHHHSLANTVATPTAAPSTAASMQEQLPLPTDFMAFSTMSNDQLNEAIHNTDVGLDMLWDGFNFQEGTDLDWMDWSAFS